MDNKIVTTLARTFVALGFAAVRSNFAAWAKAPAPTPTAKAKPTTRCRCWPGRGNGWANCRWRWAVSLFGGFVITRVARRLAEAGTPARRIVLVGAATGTVPGCATTPRSPCPTTAS